MTSLADYVQPLVRRLFGPNPDPTQIITGIALGAVAAVTLPELANLASWLRLYVLHGSKLHIYQHAPLTTPTDSSLNFQAWAFVTGATDGIGYGFVCELASRNVNVILHGRNEEKLTRIINELKGKHPRLHFEPFLCDATDRASWHSKFAELIPRLRKRNINLTILVNNIGGNPNLARTYTPLSEWAAAEVNAMVDMNVTFPTQVTRALLPILIANKPSLIINMSSMAASNPFPWLTTYCASKAFNSQFSKALRVEMAAEGHGNPEEGVEVLSITAAKVQSAGMQSATSFSVPSSRDFARSVFSKVGCGEDEVVGWWAHSVQVWMSGFFNDGVKRWITKRLIGKEKEAHEKRMKKGR